VPLAFHLGREADHSPPSSAEVKEWVELYLHSPNAPSWRGAQLGEHRGNFLGEPLMNFTKHISECCVALCETAVGHGNKKTLKALVMHLYAYKLLKKR
jgi:hypothetical protein